MSKNRPISDDVTDKARTLPPYSGDKRRLSDIAEDRRCSVPEDILKKHFERLTDNSKIASVYT